MIPQRLRQSLVALLAIAACCTPRSGVTRPARHPRVDQLETLYASLVRAVPPPPVVARWCVGPRGVEYVANGRPQKYDIDAGRFSAGTTAQDDAPEPLTRLRPEPATRVCGTAMSAMSAEEEATAAVSPDGEAKAFLRGANLWVADVRHRTARQLKRDGGAAARIRYGTLTWVYGYELGQTAGLWWSPDSRYLAYYRFDETQVPLANPDATSRGASEHAQVYPLAGSPDPRVDVYVYDRATSLDVRLDVHLRMPDTDDDSGHYVFDVVWSRDSREVLLKRMNRRQNHLELAGCRPLDGRCRAIVTEQSSSGWIDPPQEVVFLRDGRRFIWPSDRNGWRNYYLYDLAGHLLAALTRHTAFEAAELVKIDEAAGLVFYMARDGDNIHMLQLHRVRLDGSGDVRLTDTRYHHAVAHCTNVDDSGAGAPCGISPDNQYVFDLYQSHSDAPAARVIDAGTGRVVAELARTDLSGYRRLKLMPAEAFTYTSSDGRTRLAGVIDFPPGFDPSRKYPVLVAVYGAPGSPDHIAREMFTVPNALVEFGFLVVNLDSRTAPGRGREVRDSAYLALGQVEVDDVAAGVRAMWDRPYVDRRAVGIYGGSYGGYVSLMAMLRHPDVFAAGVASSAVTDWRGYDSVFTERYMWTPAANPAAYDRASAVLNASRLRGHLLVYYSADDEVVPSTNSIRLIEAFRAAGKRVQVLVGRDRGHGAVNRFDLLRFFLDHLARDGRPRG